MARPDLNLLPVLDALLQEVSVAGAARRLGLSAAAASHALARLRAATGDPLLVRAGRGMVLTPRAEALRARVRAAGEEAAALLGPDAPFAPERLARTFTVHATDNVLAVLGAALSRHTAAAPKLVLRFRPNVPEDADALREGRADLAVGIYGELPPELRQRRLYTDRFVCAVRADHPAVGDALELETFLALGHVQVAPRGRPGGALDALLAERGLARRVTRVVPFFASALLLAAEGDDVVTLPERFARRLAPRLGLRLLEPPLPPPPYALSLLWHPRMDRDPAHRWLREAFLAAAREAAPEPHRDASARLPPAGRARRPAREPRRRAGG